MGPGDEGNLYLWESDGSATKIGKFDSPRADINIALINDAGQVYTDDLETVFIDGVETDITGGVLWHNGTVTEVPYDALAINNMGQLLVKTYVGDSKADYVWENGNTLVLTEEVFVNPEGWVCDTSIRVFDMNDSGQIAARMRNDAGDQCLVLLTPVAKPVTTPLAEYDKNGDNQWDKTEAVAALTDYLVFEKITREEAIAIVTGYLLGQRVDETQ